MLDLRRLPGEQVVLSNGITLTVVEVIGGWVRLAIDAPDQVHVARAELACRHGGPDADLDDRLSSSRAFASDWELQPARRYHPQPQRASNGQQVRWEPNHRAGRLAE